MISKGSRLYYAFYGERWDGQVELRGLCEGGNTRLPNTGAAERSGRCIGYGESIVRLVQAFPPAGGNAARWDVSVAGAILQPVTRLQGVARVRLGHHGPVGRVGRLHRSSAERGFPETLVYCVWSLTMIPPALYALAHAGWRLDRDLRSVGYGMISGCRRRRSDVLFSP